MIYFVGAGPGDEKLITVRGAELLRGAEAVLYAGSTVGESVLKWCRPEAVKADSRDMTLREIIDLLSCWSKKYQTIVRLHSGDPSIYSAIGEEIEELKKIGLGAEVVPGVSAYSALAAKLSMELTIPEITQTVLITRFPGNTIVPEDLESFFSQTPASAIYLSGAMFESVLSTLKRYYPPDSIFAMGHKISREGEVIISKRLEEWTGEEEVPPNLTLFLVRKSGSVRSELYSEKKRRKGA